MSATKRAARGAVEKPAHYKIICISLYTDDMARLDAAVAMLKARGHTRASRSSGLRGALLQVDLAEVPRGV